LNKFSQWLELLRKPSIGRRFAIAILAFSSIVTLGSTVLQLSIEYDKDVGEINSQLDQIRDGYSQSLASSLWVTSQKDLKLQLDGIIKLPDMQYIEVLSDKDEVMAIAGKTESSQIISQYYPLHYQHRGQNLLLGKLHIVATLDGVYARLKSEVIVILLTQGIKTFLVSLFILYLFQVLVGRYISKIAQYASSPTNTLNDTPLILGRKELPNTKGDELVQVVDAINGMRQNLKTYYQELEESEFRWKFALEGSGAGVWDWNISGNSAFYSHHWIELIGYADHEIGNSVNEFSDRLHPEDKAATFAALQDYLDGKSQNYSHEYRFRHKDGRYIWMLANGMIVSRDAAGKPTRMIGAHHDISEKKAAEEREAQLSMQLLQATKMESIGHLTGGIAHDFNNILGAIMGYAELSQSMMAANPDVYGKVPRYMGEILTGSERAKQLIQQMLIFSRQSQDFKGSPTDAVMLTTVMKEVVSLLRSSIPASITLNYEIRQKISRRKYSRFNCTRS
jgi:PAS domain S-box-containing protein